MKIDVDNFLQGKPGKMPSKETLNNKQLIEYASGLDVYQNTSEAYLRAYKALGIDIINRVPLENAPPPMEPGKTKPKGDYIESNLGVYNTVVRNHYPFLSVDDFMSIESLEFDYHKLITPVPHKLENEDIKAREYKIGELGYYYYQLYTTLFMWGVEVLGWETYMMAAALNPEKFDRMFLQPAFEKSKILIKVLCNTDCPFVFLHDDLADARGPIFSPGWYKDYIFPRYIELFKPIKESGKKIIYVADGNMEPFFSKLVELEIDGVMFENPATSFDAILEAFKEKIVIGGIETNLLTFGNPEEIRRHVYDVRQKTENCPGFVISTPGGIHGNIPLKNLIAYFDARVNIRATPSGWKE